MRQGKPLFVKCKCKCKFVQIYKIIAVQSKINYGMINKMKTFSV